MIDAAVLLLVYNDNILFIKRNKKLKKHAGEVSFPGGKFDKTIDNNLLDTAIRETKEEIGLKKNFFKIIKELPLEKTVSTNFIVYTFVGKIIKKPIFKINKREVEEIIFIPIEHLKNKKFKAKVPLKINGKLYLNTFYYYENYLIWGATSRILDNFLNNDKH